MQASDSSQLTAYLSTLAQQMEQLKIENEKLSQRLNANARPEYFREPDVEFPEKFSGKSSQLKNFIASIRNIVELRPLSYNSDRRKTGLVGSLCTHDALNWYRSLQDFNSPLLQDFESFVGEMTLNFGDANFTEKARKRLLELNQGNKSASSYASRFRLLAPETGFDQETLLFHFERGLNSDVRRAIAVNDKEFTLLEDIIKYAIKVDNRLFESNFYDRSAQQVKSPSVMNIPTPMDIGSVRPRGPLDASEKDRRRRLNLCLYCGKPGHLASSCPNKKSSQPNAHVSSVSVTKNV